MAAKQAVKKAAAKKPAAKKPAAKKAPVATKAMGKRADLGAPADGYFAAQPADKRALLEQLRALVKKAAPRAHESIKWGMPFYELDGSLCSLAGFKNHVSLHLFAPPEVLADPEGRLEGSGKTMRQLKVRSAADIDAASIQRWVKAAAAHQAG
jgi:hypothetical protein